MNHFLLTSYSDMPRKFRLGRHGKNEERKKYAAKLPLLDQFSNKENVVVSISLQVLTNAPVDSPESLKRRLQATGGIPTGNDNSCTFCEVNIVYKYVCGRM